MCVPICDHQEKVHIFLLCHFEIIFVILQNYMLPLFKVLLVAQSVYTKSLKILYKYYFCIRKFCIYITFSFVDLERYNYVPFVSSLEWPLESWTGSVETLEKSNILMKKEEKNMWTIAITQYRDIIKGTHNQKLPC